MTFSIMVVKDEQPRVVGTLWANDQANAELMAPALCRCTEGESVSVRRTEDREIPLRLADSQALHFNRSSQE